MKPKRCQEYIPEIGCVAGYGYPIDSECRGHKKSCHAYWNLSDKDVIKVKVKRRTSHA